MEMLMEHLHEIIQYILLKLVGVWRIKLAVI